MLLLTEFMYNYCGLHMISIYLISFRGSTINYDQNVCYPVAMSQLVKFVRKLQFACMSI